MRSPLRFILPALALGASFGWTTEGRAEAPDSRFGLIPVVGAGMAGLTAPSPLPGFIGYTTLGAELFGQLRTWGLFLRFDFLSSGAIGDAGPAAHYESGWNAYSFDAGASYRLFGDSRTLSLFARGALTYEHWVGEVKTPCAIPLFVPAGCVMEAAQSSSLEGEAVGVTAGVRLEIPLQRFYVAFGANFVPLVTVSTSETVNGTAANAPALQPGEVFQLRFDLALGLRDSREDHAASHDSNEHRSKY